MNEAASIMKRLRILLTKSHVYLFRTRVYKNTFFRQIQMSAHNRLNSAGRD